MTGQLNLYDGTAVTLPVLVGWELNYTAGVPCDSFWLRYPGDSDSLTALSKAVTFVGTEDGQTVFTGVVDEYALEWGGDGAMVEISGRGMAARLLDNEAQAQDYTTATTAMLLRDHVTPYGITVADAGSLSAVPGFSISSGSSEWSVLYEFARYYNGITPRFDRYGRLSLAAFSDDTPLTLGEGNPITGLTYTEKRYGVLSSVLVQAKNQLYSTTVTNEAFLAQGGCARQVVTMPTNAAYQALRYSGRYQLQSSERERFRLAVTVAEAFWGWPGQLVTVELPRAGLGGTWRILESAVCLDETGARTALTLCERDAMI